MAITKFRTKVVRAYLANAHTSILEVNLPPEAAYKPGQFFMVNFDWPEGAPAGLPPQGKAFSVSNSPTRSPTVFAAEVSLSAYKKRWLDVKEGDEITLTGPYGAFTLRENEPKIAMIAGGIGVTPFMGYLQYVADSGLAIDCDLFYSVKIPELMTFRKELDELAHGSPNIRVHYTITRPQLSDAHWNGPTGRINADFIKSRVPDYNERLFHICAGNSMVHDMVALLESMGVEKPRIRKEEFTGIA